MADYEDAELTSLKEYIKDISINTSETILTEN